MGEGKFPPTPFDNINNINDNFLPLFSKQLPYFLQSFKNRFLQIYRAAVQ